MGTENQDVNDELDLDLEDDESSQQTQQEPKEEPKVEEGSVVVDLDELTKDDKPKDETVVADTNEAEEEAERERIREARRQERADRKRKAKEREERIQRELQSERTARRQLEERLAVVERKSTGAEMAQLDETVKQTERIYKHYKDQIKVGHDNSDGALVAEATEKMLLAQQKMEQLNRIKQGYQQRQSAPPPLDPMLVNHANTFMDKHTWYKADSNDTDAVILRTLDNTLAGEGWDPKTKEYWSELDARIKKYLPHRAGGATVNTNSEGDQTERNTKPRPKTPVAGSGRESAVVGNKFVLSKDRVDAMKEAGMWDDPVLRKEQIRRYAEYDKQNKG